MRSRTGGWRRRWEGGWNGSGRETPASVGRLMIDATSMHRYTDTTERVAQALLAYARDRLRLNPVPLDGPRSREELAAEAGRTITPNGLGAPEALRIFAETLAPATVSVDNPRYLAFIPAAPTELATLFDLVVGASSVYGGSWLEGRVRSTPRTRRCAGWPIWPACPSRPAAASSPGHDRQPVGAGGGARGLATLRRVHRPAPAWPRPSRPTRRSTPPPR